MIKAIFAFLVLINCCLALDIGDKVSDVTAETMMNASDKMIMMSLLERESDLVVIELMSTDCRTCIASMPAMSELASAVAQNVAIKTVAIDRELDNYFFNEYTELILYPFIFDFKRVVAANFELQFTPTIFILNQDNRIIYKHVGKVGEEEVAKMMAVVNVQNAI